MFDVKTVSMRIHDARIKKNMTQSNLADELGVSFQAVSNWERGNSLPDISKYEDLCRILGVDLEYLLGIGSDTDTVSKLIGRGKGEENVTVTVKEIAPIAQILPPEELKEVVEENSDHGEMGMDGLIGLAPFLDSQTMEELTAKAVPRDISELIAAAPFVSEKGLAELAERLLNRMGDGEKIPLESVVALAPFLKNGTVGKLLEYAVVSDFGALAGIAPFVPRKKLEELAAGAVPSDITQVVAIAPFLSGKGVEELIMQLENREEVPANFVVALAPFVGRQVLDGLLEQTCVDDSAVIAGLAPFVSEETLRRLIHRVMK